jgi:hypothetical protein
MTKAVLFIFFSFVKIGICYSEFGICYSVLAVGGWGLGVGMDVVAMRQEVWNGWMDGEEELRIGDFRLMIEDWKRFQHNPQRTGTGGH